MKTWAKLLPFFIVEWLAKRNCKTLGMLNNRCYVKPFENVLIILPSKLDDDLDKHAPLNLFGYMDNDD